MTLPTHPPAAFSAGTTVSFTWPATVTALGTVSAAGGWALTWHLRGARVADVTATYTDDRWTLALTASASQALAAGAYSWVLRASRGADRVDLASGVVTVTPDLVAAGPGDALTFWSKVRDAAQESYLAILAGGGAQMYMIDGRQWIFKSADEAKRALDNAEAQLAREASGGVRATVTIGAFGRSERGGWV